MSLLDQMRAKRDAAQEDLSAILEPAERGKRDLYASESRRFSTKMAEIEAMDARIDELSAAASRNAQGAATAATYAPGAADGRRSPVTIGAEPLTYRLEDRSGPSFFADFAAVKLNGNREASERIAQAQRETRALSGTAGAGGELDPPGWYVDSLIAMARPGRVTANVCAHRTLPSGVASINLPKVATGTSTAIQPTQGSALSNTDATTSSLVAPVVTIGGFQTMSQQLIDQSPVNVDEVILADLAADIAKQLDLQVIGGSGTAGQMLGIINVSAPNTVQYTDASPAVGGTGKLYAQLMKAIGLVATNRFAPATAIVMHPNRWAWIAASSDTANRPLVVPIGADAGQAFNPVGTQTGLALGISDGLVGHIAGVPVFADANIGTTYNTNQDAILVLRADDLWLYEGTPRLEIIPQQFATTLSVVVRAYNYYAFLPHRYPKSVALIGGLVGNTSTGLLYPPTF